MTEIPGVPEEQEGTETEEEGNGDDGEEGGAESPSEDPEPSLQ